MSKEETNALKSLASDENIVIKEADKGGAVVIMDTAINNGYAFKHGILY